MSPSILFRLAALAVMAIATVPSIAQDNHAPEFTTAPYPIADVGHDYRYDADAVDGDEDPSAFEMLEGPPDATLDAATGELLWVPDEDDIGMHPLALRVSDPHEAYSEQRAELRVLEDFCPIYPIALPRAVVEPLAHGDRVNGMERGTGPGNFSWLTWDGDVDAPRLAQSLLPPGDSYTYVGPTDPTDTLLEIGDWAQGATGSMNSNAIRTNLDSLLHEDIVLPVWEDRRAQGSNFDYLVWRFAIVRLTDYRLTGNGWISFEFRGYANCHNDPPVAHDQHVETLEDTPVAITLTGEDRDGGAITFELLSDTANGTLSGDAPELRYTPDADWNGGDAFKFRAFDGEFWSKPATVVITVGPVNDPAVAYDLHVDTLEDAAVAIPLTGSDVEGDAISYEVLGAPEQGALTGTVGHPVYTPNPNFYGLDQFQFRVSDGDLWSQPATVSIAVTPVNDAPIITSEPVAVAYVGQPYSYQLEASDADGDVLGVAMVESPTGMAIDESTRLTTWTPTSAGSYDVSIRVGDGRGGEVLQSFSIQVDAPTAIAPAIVSTAPASVDEQGIAIYPVHATDDDTGDVIAYSLDLAPSGATIEAVTGLLQWPSEPAWVGTSRSNSATCRTPVPGNEPFLDLRSWAPVRTAGGHEGTGTWGIDPNDPTLAHYLPNTAPAMLVAPIWLEDGAVEFTLGTIDGDDDYIGFVWGYRSAQQYYVFRWGEQNCGRVGCMSVVRVDTSMPTYEGQAPGVTELARIVRPWERNIDYRAVLDVQPGRSSITIHEGNEIIGTFDIEDDRFVGGRFGFYNHSQPGSNYQARLLPTRPGPDLSIGDVQWRDDVLSVTVRNRGTAASTSGAMVNLDAIDAESGTTIRSLGMVATGTIESGGSGPMIVPVPEAQLDFTEIRVKVDSDNTVLECDEANNERSVGVFVVRATDSDGLFDRQGFTLQVEDVNTPPTFTSTPPTGVSIGHTLVYFPRTTDSDLGEEVRYELLKGPGGMQIVQSTGQVTGTPAQRHVGQHYAVRIRAVDLQGGADEQAFQLAIKHDPVITSTPVTLATYVPPNPPTYYYDVEATDPDGDILAYRLVNPPENFQIDPQTGEIACSRCERYLGAQDPFSVEVEVTDAYGGRVIQQFEVIAVTESSLPAGNPPPAFTSTPVLVAKRLQPYRYQAVAVDDIHGSYYKRYRLLHAPAGMTIHPSSGEVEWTPSVVQWGEVDVVIEVSNQFLATAHQAFRIQVESDPTNTPPQIVSEPLLHSGVYVGYAYDAVVVDVDGDAVKTSLSVAPDGMLLEAEGGRIHWAPQAHQVGEHEVELRVDDGRGGWATQSWSIIVTDGSSGANQSPAITSIPTESMLLGSTYEYAVLASDPDGDSLNYVLGAAPSGMAFDSAGVLRWTPLPGQVGDHAVAFVVSDGRGGEARQSFVLNVSNDSGGENRVPTISSRPPTQAKIGYAYRYPVQAFDADGDPLDWSLTTAPPGMQIDAAGVITWVPEAISGAAVAVRVADAQAWVEQSWIISVADGSVPLTASVSVTPDPVRPGEPITITLDVDGASGPITVIAIIGDKPLPLQPGGSTTVTAPVDPGTHTVVVVVDDGTDSIEVIETFTVGIADDAVPPMVQLIAPVEGPQEEILVLTAPTPVIGTVSDDNLTRWVLVLRERGSTATTVLAEGVGSVGAATIGQVDPTLLANGQYLLGLQAWDAGGNTASDTRPVVIEGDMKLGHFSITFEDLTVPVAGIPITVSRTYDTRRSAADLDFGHGWSVDYQSVRVQESRAPGYAWDLNVYPSGPLGLVPNWCVESALGNVVSVVLPDGEVERFRARAQPECNEGVAILDVSLVFEPMDGTYSKLEALDDAYGRLINGSLADAGDPDRPIDPSRYRLTTPEGREFTLDEGFGIREIHEREGGNTITFTRDGILHSSGVGVTFERDAAGRIERIIAPDGTDLHYGYDGNGDLRSFTDAVDNVTTFAYEPRLAHYLQDIVDPNGVRVARNIYDDDGRLVKIIDADGNEIVYERDIQGRTEVVYDRNGNPTSYVYNERGDVLLETNAEDESIERTHDRHGNQETESNDEGETRSWTYLRARVATETNGEQETTSYTYGPFNQLEVQIDALDNEVFRNRYANTTAGGVPIFPGPLTSITDANGNVTSFGYHPTTGELASITDASGTTTMVHDHRGFLTAQTDALGNRTDYVNDDMGRVLTETRRRTLPDGTTEVMTTVHTYDDKGRLVATLHPDLSTTTTEYDGNDRPVVECDALDRCTTTTYDARGNIARIDHPGQTFETRSYDPNGNLVSQTDRAGRTTRYGYDKANRLVETIHPDDTPADDSDNPRSRNEYDRAGRLHRSVDERGNATTYGYDLAGRRTSVTDALGNTTTTEHDAASRRSAVVDPEGHRTEYVYDDGGRLLETVFVPSAGSGEAVTRVKVEYDAAGRKVADIDAMGRITRYAYDPLGRLVTVVLPDPATGANPPLVNGASLEVGTLTTTYAYDEVGNKIAQTDAEGRTTRWAYDAMGREVARILPEGEREEKRYNAAGELVEHTDFNGLTTRYTYDDAGRLATIAHARDPDVAFGYLPTGERDTAIDGRGISFTDYDERGRVERVTDADGAIIEYEYDEADNLTARISPSQSLVYTYDDANRLHQVVRTIDGEPPMTTTYEYDADGNRSAMETGDGIRTEYTYDSRHRLRDLVKRTAAGALMVAMTYTVDASGMRTAVEEVDPAGTTCAVTWAYDSVKRLTAEAIDYRDDWNDRTTAWTYDRVGNRLTQTRTVAGVTDSTTYTYDTNDRLRSEATTGGDTPGTTNYAYDDNGNTTQRAGPTGTVDYTWNDANRLVAAAGPDGTTTYVYDADGLRVRKTHTPAGGTPTTTWYVQDNTYAYAQVIEQYESVGGAPRELAATFTFADDLIAQTRYAGDVAVTHHVHPDGFGSTRWLTASNGTITDGIDYDAFGNEIGRVGSTDIEHRYRSEAFDPKVGLYYLRARHVDARSGRFASMDPFSGVQGQPSTLNKYIYGNANPVAYNDPSGLVGVIQLTSIGAQVGRSVSFLGTRAGVHTVAKFSAELAFEYATGIPVLTSPRNFLSAVRSFRKQVGSLAEGVTKRLMAGQSFEKAVLSLWKPMTKNKLCFKNGREARPPGCYIPDFYATPAGRLVEIKNSAGAIKKRQFQEFLLVARESGKPMTLVLREKPTPEQIQRLQRIAEEVIGPSEDVLLNIIHVLD